MASQVVANGWELSDLNNHLWLGLECSQHLERHSFVVKVCAGGDWLALVVDDFGAGKR